jgi:hypothetical protein
MASRALRSRTVEPSQDMELPAGESECDEPSEQPEGLGSAAQTSGLTIAAQQEAVAETQLPVVPLQTRPDSKPAPSEETSDL